MASKIKVLNIGAFDEKDTWFLGDMKSFHHFFSLLPEAEVESKQILYQTDEDGNFKFIDNDNNQIYLFLEWIKQFSSESLKDDNTCIACIVIHGHGELNNENMWQLKVGDKKLASILIFRKLKALLREKKVLLILNSCYSEQSEINTHFISNLEQPILTTIPINFSRIAQFAEYEFVQSFNSNFNQENQQIKSNECKVDFFKIKNKDFEQEHSFLKYEFNNNVTFYEKPTTKHLYFLSISSFRVELANTNYSFGGIVCNMLCLLDDILKLNDLWSLIKVFLSISNSNYHPCLSVHSISPTKAIKEFYGQSIDFGFNYQLKPNKLINSETFNDIEIKKK